MKKLIWRSYYFKKHFQFQASVGCKGDHQMAADFLKLKVMSVNQVSEATLLFAF